MYQSGDRKREQVSTNHDAKNRKAPVDVEETPRMKQAAQLQAMADDFVDAKAVVQRRRVTVVYGNESVVGYNTENLTLSQLQNLLNSPYLTQENRGDIEAAIANGEYMGAPRAVQAMDVEQDAPPPPQQLPPPQSMGPPPSRFPPQQVNMGPPQPMGPPSQPSGLPQSMGPPQFFPPVPRVNPQQGTMGTPSPFAMPAAPMGRGKSSASAPRVVSSVPQEQFMTLYRGLNSLEQGARIEKNMTAGGDPVNRDCGKPGEQSVVAQVGMDDVAPWASKATPFKPSDVTEYSTSLKVAQDAATGKEGGVITVRINSKYLSPGDGGVMKGWIALRCAPLESFKWDKPNKPDDDPDEPIGT